VPTYKQALRRLRQEDHKFQGNLGYIVRPCLRKRKEKVLFTLKK
jgi:hypothetical protein